MTIQYAEKHSQAIQIAPAAARWSGFTRTQNASLTPDPVDRQDFVNAMGGAVTGVTVVSTDGPAGRFGLTVSAVSSVSADPPMVLACINRHSPACAAVRSNGIFCINVLSTQQRHVAETFSGHPAHGRGYDFGCAEWQSAVTGAPCLSGAISLFDCVLESACDSGSHTVFIGRVLAVRQGSGRPLLYTDRSYGYPCRCN